MPTPKWWSGAGDVVSVSQTHWQVFFYTFFLYYLLVASMSSHGWTCYHIYINSWLTQSIGWWMGEILLRRTRWDWRECSCMFPGFEPLMFFAECHYTFYLFYLVRYLVHYLKENGKGFILFIYNGGCCFTSLLFFILYLHLCEFRLCNR